MQRWNLLFILIFATEGVHSTFSKISTAKELQDFSTEVNKGTTYNGLAVELTGDIDLSGTSFTRIGYFLKGNNVNTDFRGVFNGNGYLIKNMNLTSSDERFLGLFGYSNGGTFQNIVIDSSCSVTNMMDPNVSYAAGIVAYANGGGDGATTISNCVNMATITGTGTKTRLGGIAGVLYAYSKEARITDCVNLGNIVHLGTGEEIYAGGLVGWLTGEDNNKVSVSSCMNLGFVTSSPQNTGGIAGYSNKIIFTVSNNYWMEGTSSQGCSGPVTGSGNERFNSSDNSIIEKFNSIIPPSVSNKFTWYTITFDSNEGSQVESMLAMKVLIGKPGTPTKTGHTFDGWYMNSSLTVKWDQSTEFSGNSTLYAKWTPINYTISIMNESNEFVTNITGPYGTNVALPDPNSTKEGYSFGGWLDATKNITYMNTINVSGDVQLQKTWILNAYQVKFDYGNGTISTPFYVYYEKIVEEPEHTARIGYTFDGWFKDKDFNEPVLFPMKMKANNITFYAKWIEQSEYVKIIFGSSNLTQEEALALIHKYTDDTFVVIKFEGDKDTNEAYIIVKFNDVSTASKVYERFQNDSDDDNLVTGIEFMTQYVSISFSQDFLMPNFITFIYLIMNIVLIVDF